MQTTADKYARGGALYLDIESRYGTAAANAAWQAAITAEKNQTPLETSVAAILATYSPSDWLNNSQDYWTTQAQNVGNDFFKNLFTKPVVLLLVLALGAGVFVWFGGLSLLKKK